MLTAIFEASRDQVDRYAAQHLTDPVLRSVGRLTAVQSSTFEELDASAVREIAEAYNLPLRNVVDRPPFPRPKVSALPPRRRRAQEPRRAVLALGPGSDG